MLIARTIRTIAAAFPAVTIAIAAPTISATAAMLVTFTLGSRAVALTFSGKLMELRRLPAGHRRRLGTRLLSLLLLRLLRLPLPAVTSVGTRPAIGTPILALPLAVALLGLAVTATLLEAAVLLAVAATAVTPAIATLVAIAALLLVAAVVALLLLRLSLDRCWRRRLRRGGGRREEAAEDACQETLCRWDGR